MDADAGSRPAPPRVVRLRGGAGTRASRIETHPVHVDVRGGIAQINLIVD
jgi:hypothetical protein